MAPPSASGLGGWWGGATQPARQSKTLSPAPSPSLALPPGEGGRQSIAALL